MSIIIKNITTMITINEIRENQTMVKWYWECNGCGSIVIHFDNGSVKSVTEQYIKDNKIDLTKAIKLMKSDKCENCFPMEKFCENLMKIK